MNIKEFSIFILCFIFFISIIISNKENVIILSSLSSREPYIFVTEWGSRGSEQGQFGGFHTSRAEWFEVTDNTIKNLKGKIDNEHLEILKSLKGEVLHRNKFAPIVKDLESNSFKMIMDAAVTDKPGDKCVNGPLSITADKSGNIYVSDFYNNRVQKFDSNGNFLRIWGSEGDGDGQFNAPAHITVGSEGYIYVVDYKNYCIQKFDSEGNFIIKWGKRVNLSDFYNCTEEDIIKKYEDFNCPRGIAVDESGCILMKDLCQINDRTNDFIKKFDPEGNFITNWFLRGDIDRGFAVVRFPRFNDRIAIDKEGYLYAICRSGTTIKTEDSPQTILVNIGMVKYDLTGKYITNWGKWGQGDGEFENPVDVAVGPDGNIFVLERNTSPIQHHPVQIGDDWELVTVERNKTCVQKFDSNGNFICKWGSLGSGPGEFNRPEAIAVDPDGNVYVMDTGNYRIQKFAPNPDFNPNN